MKLFRQWLDEYESEIRPLREAADRGEGSYTDYDEAYNIHLEYLHVLVRDHVAAGENPKSSLDSVHALFTEAKPAWNLTLKELLELVEATAIVSRHDWDDACVEAGYPYVSAKRLFLIKSNAIGRFAEENGRDVFKLTLAEIPREVLGLPQVCIDAEVALGNLTLPEEMPNA